MKRLINKTSVLLNEYVRPSHYDKGEGKVRLVAVESPIYRKITTALWENGKWSILENHESMSPQYEMEYLSPQYLLALQAVGLLEEGEVARIREWQREARAEEYAENLRSYGYTVERIN